MLRPSPLQLVSTASTLAPLRQCIARTAIAIPIRRSLTTSAPSAKVWQTLKDTAGKLLVGDRKERQLMRQRGGLMPEEMRRLRDSQKQQTAYAALSADGEALLEEPEELEVFKSEKETEQHLSAKRLDRAARKRWGATIGDGDVPMQHKYSTARFKISPRKLGMLAKQIGRDRPPVDSAIVQMSFSDKRAAKRVRATLCMARDHAIARGMDAQRLVVAQAWVGKGQYLKRIDIKGRGRMGIKHHPEAQMSIVLEEGSTPAEKRAVEEAKVLERIRRNGMASVVRHQRTIVNTHQHPGWAW